MRALALHILPIVLASLMTAPVAEEKPPCSDPAYHQFDFWIGDWEVRTPDGALAGTNRIVGIEQGCALQESWEGKGGMTGTSLNAYDRVRDRWHQTWVDSHGSLLLLEGTFKDGKLILSGPARPSPGGRVADRITWEPIGGGTVRQLWEQSSDGGRTWAVVFDGRYSRRH